MYGDRERWKLEEYLPQVRVPFEGVLLPVPKNYDIYLSNLYHDYMQLPPEDKKKRQAEDAELQGLYQQMMLQKNEPKKKNYFKKIIDAL